MGGKGSGGARSIDIKVDQDEVYRSAGERAKFDWWRLFKLWAINHLNDPELVIEAAFMDGYRQGVKDALGQLIHVY